MLAVHWATDYPGASGSSLGYANHNAKMREALGRHVKLSDDGPVAMHVCPPHRFEPVPGKINIASVAWEASELPDKFRKLEAADAVLVTSEFLIEPFRRLLPGKAIHCVPLGVDGELFSYVDRSRAELRPIVRPRSKRPFRFMWLGAPNARKGPLHVLEAWKAFCEGPFAKFRDQCELYIKTSCTADGYKPDIKRVGNVTFDSRLVAVRELVSLYHRAHAFVFPSGGEGFGLTAAEAAATGLPLIYTPATALGDVFPTRCRYDRRQDDRWAEMDADEKMHRGEPYGFPVRYSLVPTDWSWSDVGDGTPLEAHVMAASADTFHLAYVMHEVMADPLTAFEVGRAAADRIRRLYHWGRVGVMLHRIVSSAFAQAA